MKKQTNLAQTIDLADNRARYDECAKKLLAYQSIIAWILKSCTNEFSQYSISYICENCLKEEVQISRKAVHQDELDKSEQFDGNVRIDELNSESTSIKEQTVYYDIRFRARVPEEAESIQLIINLEIQLNDTPGYPLIKRGIYYCSRMISEQYGTVFTKEDYAKIQKVYSIWICPDPAKKRANGIFRYRMIEETIYGKPYEKLENYDLAEVVIMNLGDARKQSNVEILNLLNTLFSSTITAEEKKKRLETEFKIAMTTELDEEVETMCNLSQALVNQGIEQGIERGIEQGNTNGAKGIIRIGKEFKLSDSDILKRLQEDLHISLEQAQDYLNKFGK